MQHKQKSITMNKYAIISLFILAICGMVNAQNPTAIVNAKTKGTIPLVYAAENTGSKYRQPLLPSWDELPVVKDLPNPLEWSNGNGQVKSFKQWERRRNEIAAEIQHYGIGTKPTVNKKDIRAWMNGDTLGVIVKINGQTLVLYSEIKYPKVGQPPYALMIGTSGISLPKRLFDNRPIATMIFHEAQVNDYSQWRKHKERGEHNFDHLYPHLSANGAYSEWAWGLSRMIDGLQLLGEEKTKIDMKHIGVTGCSYAGKMALYCGAFDERIALTIACVTSTGRCGESGKDRLPLVFGKYAQPVLWRQRLQDALRPS